MVIMKDARAFYFSALGSTSTCFSRHRDELTKVVAIRLFIDLESKYWCSTYYL